MNEKRPKLRVVGGTEYVPERVTPEKRDELELQKLEALVRKITDELPEDYDTSFSPERLRAYEEVRRWPISQIYKYLAQEDRWEHRTVTTAVIEEYRARVERGDFSPRS
jgi:hypothetical protein